MCLFVNIFDLISSSGQVGDSIDDMMAGYQAGAATVLLASEDNEELKRHAYTGRWIGRLDELIGILEDGFEEVGREEDKGKEGEKVMEKKK